METSRRQGTSFGDVLDRATLSLEKKWFQVFMPALRTFRSLFGHADVPEGFIVPQSSPLWPQATWGLHLGQIISRSNDTKKLYSSQMAISQPELNKLGFTWTTTNTADRSWKRQILPALLAFHREQGHCNVPATFVVPEWESWPQEAWRLNLGAIVKRIRAGRSYADQSALDSKILNSVGFLWDPKDVEWQERILPALATFADEFRHSPIAPDFVVPSRYPWLKQTWGLKLGAFLSDPHKREQYSVQIVRDSNVLEGLGFQVSFSDETWVKQIVPLLRIFSTHFPTQYFVPKNFTIPRSQPWPRKMWGLNLGRIAAQNPKRMIKVENRWKQRREAPETMSLVSENRTQAWRIRIFPALVTFVQVFGDCRLGNHFTVPSELPWPKATWGLRLGAGMAEYCKNGTYFEQIGRDADRLDKLGFSFKLAGALWEQLGAPLVKKFSTAYPCTVVPEGFVVPTQSPWQETMWGVRLGVLVRWNYQHMTDIENDWRVQVLKTVEIHHQVNGGTPIGDSCMVPSQSPWPSKTWGMDLALVLQRLQNGHCYDGHVVLARNSVARVKYTLHRQRDEAWESIFTALRIYSRYFGDCNVNLNFVVPDNLSWPKPVWNMPLGQIVEKMKMTGNFFTYIGRCAGRLSKLRFSLPLSNFAWEKKVAPLIATFAKLHPKDSNPFKIWGFTIPSEKPWPESSWGINLGLIIQWNQPRLEAIERDWKDQVLTANDVFQYENENKILRDDFVVPSRSPWPYQTWGRELRHITTCIQVGQHYGGHVAIANFQSTQACVVSSEENEQWKSILSALDVFFFVFGHCSVPDDFIVPSESPWPKGTFGLSLGKIVWEVENYGVFFTEVGLNADRLETLGFRYKLADSAWLEHVAPLLEIFAAQYPHEVLPEEFVVPSKGLWPEEMHGFRLGKIVSWCSRFNFSDQEQWEERKGPGSLEVYGYCKVPLSFKVPSELPWPKQMWGLKMETYLRQLNQCGHLFLSGGLHRALTSGNAFGFAFKLEMEGVSFRKAESENDTAPVEQIEEPFNPRSQLGKRFLLNGNCQRKEGWIGSYSPEARRKRIRRFLKKREERVWAKEVKYTIRKSFADTRLRVKGRFVMREDEKNLRELLSFT
ncbi:hypothetical protein P3T76_014896 [Phytophthora citrophthora]|uniref:CCT domain-containing protein n=1 Tax=Phytophthora citrophthora TaxID=4793 RepID=A0AAD9LBX3_9STRA|nr:hypothetical protein P3T76_014896 [Phytophthora citrophthora]